MMTRLLPLVLLSQFLLGSADAQQPNRPPNPGLGDAVVTGFSGTTAPTPGQPLPANKSAVDLTFINPDGPSARIVGVGRPGYVWDGRLFQAPKTFDVLAKDVGQVFGVALDDQVAPNIYLAATSAFGLHLVGRGRDGLPERRKTGGAGAGWMKGQFGLDLQGDPGSIYKVDGTTGVISLFAKVLLEGVPNPGPALGNLAYDAVHKQLFVSDLHTGMIHRFAIADGSESGPPFDHGVSGRPAANQAPVPFNPANRANIANTRFNSENPDTWGFAPPTRRVWGLAVHDGRLYYSARNGQPANGPQIFSVGIQPDGSFGADARFELDVAGAPYPVSDIAFSQKGAMILAQRAPGAGSYDYSAFTAPGEPRVLRYWLKDRNDPPSPGLWKPLAEEYAVGFAGNYRNANGGVALGYGYGQDGMLGAGACEAALWSTGQNLRNNPALRSQLEPGGPLVVHGLQGSPIDLVRGGNEPPATAYYVDYDDRFDDARASGHMGSVRILARPCVGAVASGAAGSTTSPPYVSGPTTPTSGDCPAGRNPDGTCGPVRIDLAIKKTASEGKYDPATGLWTFQFTLTVTNVGNPFLPANHIVINDPVPNGLTFTAAAGTNWNCSATTFPLSSGNLNCFYNYGPGQIATGATLPPLVVTLTAATAGKYENCATTAIRAAPWLQETTLANNKDCATIVVPVDLAIKKTAGEVKYDAATGSWTFQYTLTVTNVGAAISPASPNVIAVSDPVPAGLTFASATGGGWNCNAPPALSAGALTCAYTGAGTIAHNQVLGAITITVTVKNEGKYENCATVGVTAASGLQETTLANNRSCVTVVIRKTPPPPELNPQCGVNVIFVVDVSTSIVTAGATNQVQSALNNAKSLFNNTNASGVPAQGAVVTFSTGAQVLQPMSAGTLSTFPALTFGGDTNWEAGLQLAYTLAQAGPQPALILFISDGEPNYYVDNAGTNQFTSNAALATTEAQAVVSQIYGLNPPVPILGIGIGNITTYLNQLLGGNFQQSSFGALNGDLQSFAKKACPDLYLYKSINPSFINYYNNPGPHQATITLTLQNTNGALTNVQVKDVLPAQLTNPTSTDPNFSAAGNTVTWTLASVAANATVTLSFKVDIVPPALTCNWSTVRNTAQVTAVTPPVHSLPGNMPAGGPHEHDEAAATLWLQDCKPIIGDPGPPYLQVTKSSLESCFPQGQTFTPGVGATQTPPPPCTFTVKIQAVGNFVGNVTFSDSVIPSPGTAPVSTGIASITVTPPPLPSTQPNYCFQSFATTPNSCQQNITLNNGHVISFTITLKAPPNLAAGQYKNCFVAAKDTLPAAQQTWNPYYAATPTSWGWYNWGYCGLFGVPAATTQPRPPPPAACDPRTTIRRGNECVCSNPGMVKTSANACGCREGMNFVPGRGCVPPLVCPPPKIPNAANTACVCPEGTIPRGRECVKQETCLPPMIQGPVAGQCICPPGTVQRGRECIKPPVCPPPMIQAPGAAAGNCICPQGMVQQGRRCIPRVECRRPQIPNAAGTACVCPTGTVQRGQTCEQPKVCNPPARLNRRGECECPRDMVARGNSCIARDRPAPDTKPGGGRGTPGGRDTPGGPRGQGQGESPARR